MKPNVRQHWKVKQRSRLFGLCISKMEFWLVQNQSVPDAGVMLPAVQAYKSMLG